MVFACCSGQLTRGFGDMWHVMHEGHASKVSGARPWQSYTLLKGTANIPHGELRSGQRVLHQQLVHTITLQINAFELCADI